MKGVVTSDIIGIMLLILTVIVFFTIIFPKFLSEMIELFGKTSAESVARQLSGFITISGSAPNEIKIEFFPSRDVTYSFSIKERNIMIKPEFKVEYMEKASSSQPFAVELIEQEQRNVNHFFIEKRFEGVSNYVFYGKKE
ncbi:MAG: hypothetical protein QXG39_00925 [Candidatus Aenigmatarchaeota archaeon]